MENDEWDWKGKQAILVPDQVPKLQLKEDELVDDAPIRGKRSLFEIYQRCNVVVFKPRDFWEAEKDPKCVAAMKEELSIIEKNQTWQLVKRPTDRKVICVRWVFRTKLNADGSIYQQA